MNRSNKLRLTEGPIGRTLLRMAFPMFFGISAVVLFNIVDTVYVAHLGVRELAAMSYSFPVIYVVMSVAMGLSMGTTAVISRAIGKGDFNHVRGLTTDSLILANTVVVCLALMGVFSIEPLFTLLGAPKDMLGLIASYMLPWYWGVGFLVIPMVGNAAIRATGDAKTPALIMIIAGAINVVLDPFLIFGLGPFPRLGLQGAAVATVISWMGTFFAATWILARRERMLDFSIPKPRRIFSSFRILLYLGIPATATQLLGPLSTGVLTRMVSEYGNHVVAAFGAANRFESLLMVGIGALASALNPFVGQNIGANNWRRVAEGLRFTRYCAAVWGLGLASIYSIFAYPLASIFGDRSEVIDVIVRFLWIVSFSYIFFGVAHVVNAFFNAAQQPYKSGFIIFTRLFVLAIPLAWVGSSIWGVMGVFAGMATGNVFVGFLAVWMERRQLRS